MPTQKKIYGMQYAKDHYKRIVLELRKEYFTNVLKPASDLEELAVQTFIKISIMEKIKRDGLDLPTDLYKP